MTLNCNHQLFVLNQEGRFATLLIFYNMLSTRSIIVSIDEVPSTWIYEYYCKLTDSKRVRLFALPRIWQRLYSQKRVFQLHCLILSSFYLFFFSNQLTLFLDHLHLSRYPYVIFNLINVILYLVNLIAQIIFNIFDFILNC